MLEKKRSIDVDRLREDMENESLGAYFGGGYGGALIESFDIRDASEEELIEMARIKRIDLDKYQQ